MQQESGLNEISRFLQCQLRLIFAVVAGIETIHVSVEAEGTQHSMPSRWSSSELDWKTLHAISLQITSLDDRFTAQGDFQLQMSSSVHAKPAHSCIKMTCDANPSSLLHSPQQPRLRGESCRPTMGVARLTETVSPRRSHEEKTRQVVFGSHRRRTTQMYEGRAVFAHPLDGGSCLLWFDRMFQSGILVLLHPVVFCKNTLHPRFTMRFSARGG